MRAGILALALLAGCAGRVPTHDVVVPCRSPIVSKPVFAFDVLPLDASLLESVRALLVDREERNNYEIKLSAAIAVCQ